jgi:hypothetical protein
MAKDKLRNWVPETLSCLLTFDKATERWVGRCLDLDLATSGKTDKAAWENLGKVIKAHVETCWRRNREALKKHRAPQEDWDLFNHLSAKNKPARSDKITFDLVEPEFAEEVVQLWMTGLEFLPAGSECANKEATSSVSAVH